MTYTTRVEDLTEAEAVIEAISEDARAKGELFKRLDAGLPDARFLASNTSSIPIAELAACDRSVPSAWSSACTSSRRCR